MEKSGLIPRASNAAVCAHPKTHSVPLSVPPMQTHLRQYEPVRAALRNVDYKAREFRKAWRWGSLPNLTKSFLYLNSFRVKRMVERLCGRKALQNLFGKKYFHLLLKPLALF